LVLADQRASAFQTTTDSKLILMRSLLDRHLPQLIHLVQIIPTVQAESTETIADIQSNTDHSLVPVRKIRNINHSREIWSISSHISGVVKDENQYTWNNVARVERQLTWFQHRLLEVLPRHLTWTLFENTWEICASM
jgi:hypothetical protein